MNEHLITVESSEAPIIEYDHECAAVYVRFSNEPVIRTIEREAPEMNIAIDLDANNRVIGIDAVPVTEVCVSKLLKAARVQTPNIDYAEARYCSAALATV